MIISKELQDILNSLNNEPNKFYNEQIKQLSKEITKEDLLEIQQEKSNLNEIDWNKRKELLLSKVAPIDTFPSTPLANDLDNRYKELKEKMILARNTDFTVVSRWNRDIELKYYLQRIRIIDSYSKLKELDIEQKYLLMKHFENCNENIKQLLGL